MMAMWMMTIRRNLLRSSLWIVQLWLRSQLFVSPASNQRWIILRSPTVLWITWRLLRRLSDYQQKEICGGDVSRIWSEIRKTNLNPPFLKDKGSSAQKVRGWDETLIGAISRRGHIKIGWLAPSTLYCTIQLHYTTSFTQTYTSLTTQNTETSPTPPNTSTPTSTPLQLIFSYHPNSISIPSSTLMWITTTTTFTTHHICFLQPHIILPCH